MYYGDYFNQCPYNMYRSNANPIVDLLMEAMRDERHDRKKYDMMMDMTDDPKIKDQIRFAYEDEGKHYKLFQQIFQQLTGQPIDIPVPAVETYENLQDAVETSINGELGAVELYRKIMSMLPTQQLRDTLFEIITDEQEHATRFVYVYSMLK